jgi:HAD superfamily hydrolase (TIGR01549 family)
MAKKRVNAILFDLGDTVLEFGRVKTTRLFLKGAHSSYDFLRAKCQPVAGFHSYFLKNLFCLRWRHLVSHFTGNDFDSLEVLRALGARQGISLSEEDWRHLTWLWYEPLSVSAHVEPDLPQTFAALQQKDIKLGIISNTFVHSSALDRHLEQLNVKDFLQVRLYSYQFEFRKPDLRIFQEGARRIGEDCANIMYVGDRVDKDMLPALKLGMAPALKKARANIGKSVPTGVHVIERLSQLPDLVEQINS